MKIFPLCPLLISSLIFNFLISFPLFAGDVTEPQVQVEAKLIETSNRAAEELGVDFQAGREHAIGPERIVELQTDVRDFHKSSASGFGDQVGVNAIPELPAKEATPAVKLAV